MLSVSNAKDENLSPRPKSGFSQHNLRAKFYFSLSVFTTLQKEKKYTFIL